VRAARERTSRGALFVRIWILSINKQKKLRKIWIFSVLSFLYDFLSLENDVSVSSKRNKHENLEKKIIFC
jgi:hypothetical protein